MTQSSVLRNPHLEGSTFLWGAGSIGVLLCHGFTATTAEVRPLAQALHAHGYTVAGPLLPGHGTTAPDCNRYTWQDWYASIEQMYLQLAGSCQKVVVGGESTGALLTLNLAVNYPEIAGILCYAPALRLNNGPIINILLPLFSPFIT
jgi:carboxylesterase